MTNPPTPPRPAVPVMPKADCYPSFKHFGLCKAWKEDIEGENKGTTAIERAYTDLATQLAESRAECEGLREALEEMKRMLAHRDQKKSHDMDADHYLLATISVSIDQALTPKETPDEH